MAGAMSPKPTDADWSKFEKRLGISSELQLSAGSSSSSSSDQFDKVCVLIKYRSHCCNRHTSIREFLIYVIDVNSSDSSNTRSPQSLKPVIYWDPIDIDAHVFAMLGSKLCSFGKLDVSPDRPLSWSYDMYYYDMKDDLNLDFNHHNSPPRRLTRTSFVKGPPMSGRKVYPFAAVIGTDSNKICVFGSLLYVCGKDYSGPNFELLYTTTTTGELQWKVLPEPPLIYHELGSRTISIRSYCVHRSCLIINIPGGGVYGINLDHLNPVWVTLKHSTRTLLPFDGMFVMVDKILCNGFSMTKRDDMIHLIEFEGSATICFDDRCDTFCLVRGAFDLLPRPKSSTTLEDCCTSRRHDTSYLLLDIVKFDNLLELKSNKSFTFQLPTTIPKSCMDLVACLPIFKNASRNGESVAELVDQGKRKKKRKVENGEPEAS